MVHLYLSNDHFSIYTIIRTLSNRPSHFFGSLVSSHNTNGLSEEFLVIDGQQRLTTVSLLLLAIYKLLERKILASKDPDLKDKIYETFLIKKWEPKATRMKLKPVKNDLAAFEALFSDDEHIQSSNLSINFKYFYERIQNKEISVDQLYEAIHRLEIIDIFLSENDNAQLIFESLNSTGLALSEGDKIRNFILMSLNPELQTEYYDDYWTKIEKNTSHAVSSFMRDYLSIKQGLIPAINRVYFSFKKYVEDNDIETKDLLSDLLDYSKHYAKLVEAKSDNIDLAGSMYRLNRLETTVARPFLLEVLRMNELGVLSLIQVIEIFQLVESYVFRRMICELPTNMLNKIFLTLHKDVLRQVGSTEDYVERLKFVLLSKRDRARYPNDFDFSEGLLTKPIYQLNVKNKLYLLERLENFGTKETKNIWDHFDNNDYTIEHIMPQTLTPAWIESLGPNYEEIHQTWIHRLANLTLTAYNSRYSNRNFIEKKEMQKGFIESGLRINQWISRQSSWGLKELEERAQVLIEKCLDIWSLPNSKFIPKDKEQEFYSLDEEFDYTGSKVSRFVFANVEYPVKNWVDLYEKLVSLLHMCLAIRKYNFWQSKVQSPIRSSFHE